MKLSNLEKFNEIVSQMHVNPDADAVGSGYALYRYFKSRGKKVRLVYGGREKIKKSNMLLLLKELEIPAEYIKNPEDLGIPELLLTVDCQYGEGNVSHFEAGHIAMIDHHDTARSSDDMVEIRSHIVSCSTVCFDMLTQEGYDVNADLGVSTALYYGLFMDSNELSEIRHPLERDMIEFLNVDKGLINKITHANFTMDELETAALAMIRFSYDENKRLSIVKSKPCDPNILGLVGDMVLQVDSIDVCIIFNQCPGGYKLSVRSCDVEVGANDLAEYLTEDIGNGGGHIDKAGGFINEKNYVDIYDDMVIESYIFNRVEKYYDSFDVVYARNAFDSPDGFELYQKKPYTYGYVKSTDLFESGTEYRIRTYEGDVRVISDDDIYLIIGYMGEVYPIEKDPFYKKYKAGEDKFYRTFEYAPSVRSMKDDRNYEIMPYAKECVCRDDAKIYARPLRKATKVFTKWDYEKYMYGKPGDYICYTYDDEHDIYVIKRDVFIETYAKVK